MKVVKLALLSAALVSSSLVLAQDIKIALSADPDVLDPHRARTLVGRVVFASLCDKLVDIDENLNIVPQLATSWSWNDKNTELTFKLRSGAFFHDGSPIDANAVKANLDRARTLSDSLRKSELASVSNVQVIDPLTVKLTLANPDVSLLAQFTDRAGMMISPKQFGSDDIGRQPICSGPYKFVERVQNDKIVLEKFDKYWDSKNYHFQKVIFSAIPDSTVRLANLRSGDFQLIERVAPNDMAAVKSNNNLKLSYVTGLGYQSITVNMANGKGADNPFAKDQRVRQAFDLAIDRDVINQVAGMGSYAPSRQPFPPASFASTPALNNQKRDVQKARDLLKQAGLKTVAVDLAFAANPATQQVMELIQAMTSEAGFQVRLHPTEFATLQSVLKRGDFMLGQAGWSGRIDPDGNVRANLACDGSINDGKYCNKQVDELMAKAVTVSAENERKTLYSQAMKLIDQDQPVIYLYFQPWAFASTSKLQGFKATPDGLIRLGGVSLAK